MPTTWTVRGCTTSLLCFYSVALAPYLYGNTNCCALPSSKNFQTNALSLLARFRAASSLFPSFGASCGWARVLLVLDAMPAARSLFIATLKKPWKLYSTCSPAMPLQPHFVLFGMAHGLHASYSPILHLLLSPFRDSFLSSRLGLGALPCACANFAYIPPCRVGDDDARMTCMPRRPRKRPPLRPPLKEVVTSFRLTCCCA